MTLNATIHPRWPHGRTTKLFPAQVNRALRPEHGVRIGSLASCQNGTMTIALRPNGTLRVQVARPDQLADILARPDLTHVEGAPLVIVNPAMGVLGIAFGAPEPPPWLGVMFCSEIRDGEAVEVPGFDGNPSWALLAVLPTDDTKKPNA